MKLSNDTLEILNNFSVINPTIKFNKGNVLKTVSPIESVVAEATIPDQIDGDFCIGELPRFMRSLSLFESPEIDLGDKQVMIRGGNTKVAYSLTAEILIKKPPENPISLGEIIIGFTLTDKMFKSVQKSMSILSLPEMAIVGENGKLRLQAFDSEGNTADTYTIDVGDTDKTFRAVFREENLKLLPLDYEVQLSSRGFGKFSNPRVNYFIAIESESSHFDE